MKPLSTTVRVLALAGALAVIPMGCVYHHDHDHAFYVDERGYHHEGFYDEKHAWHGGYYDESHNYHEDPGDWNHP